MWFVCKREVSATVNIIWSKIAWLHSQGRWSMCWWCVRYHQYDHANHVIYSCSSCLLKFTFGSMLNTYSTFLCNALKQKNVLYRIDYVWSNLIGFSFFGGFLGSRMAAWDLTVTVEDLGPDAPPLQISVTSDLHIGGVILKLVEQTSELCSIDASKNGLLY